MRVTFIGLGNMGGPMAANIAMAGYHLTVCDLDPEKASALLTQGAAWCESAEDAVKDADVVMTSLPGPQQIVEMAFGDRGILQAMRPGTVWIDLSTNNLDVGRRLQSEARSHGIDILDAPVTGGVEGAISGTLTLLVGGDSLIVERNRHLLEAIGREVVHLGPHGAGYVAKIAQVVLCYLHSVALSEAMMLGVKGGVDPDTMLSIIQRSTGSSYVANQYGPAILRGDYDPGFALGLAHKDLKLTLELAQSVEADLPMCSQVEALYARASETFGAHQNHLMAVRLLEESNNAFLRSGTEEVGALSA